MPRLSVNIDHIATIRQARRGVEPDPVWGAVEAQLGGADGITFHLREDRRHIQDRDVDRLRETVQVALNFELAAVDAIIDFACVIRPTMAMLVPEKRAEITTEGGLDVRSQLDDLRSVVRKFHDHSITASAFIDAEDAQIEAAARAGFDVCEIHTGPYAHAVAEHRDLNHESVQRAIDRIAKGGALIREQGMRFNAGHGLNIANVGPIAQLDGIGELHIGHSIVSRSVFVGMREAVREMKRAISSSA